MAPTWYTIGILTFFAKDFAITLGVQGSVSNGKAIFYHYLGASIGSIIISIISQQLKSRKKALVIALSALSILSGWYFMADGVSSGKFYFILFILGMAMGYWSIFITVASEQFGTNIRSTVTTSVPNFVRGSAVLMLLGWQYLEPSVGIIKAAIIVGSIVISLAFLAVFYIDESYGKDIDYMEVD